MFGDPEYYARSTADGRWQLAKFLGTVEPAAIYTLRKQGAKWQCNCPAGSWGRPCKHPAMLADYIKRKKEILL